MRKTFAFLSSMICICSIMGAHASDCIGAGCEDTPRKAYIFEGYSVKCTECEDEPVVQEIETDTTAVATESNLIPMRNAKLLTIKPAPIDDRPPLWDGTSGEYHQNLSPKTVSWKDGVPIWDDSISNYKKKDFRDWMLKPLPEIYLRDSGDTELVELYNDTMNDAATTRARIEELLSPARPSDDLWTDKPCSPAYTAQDMTVPINEAFGTNDGCPFETETECNIWRRKPIIRETVSPRSPKIRDDKMYDFVSEISCTGNIDANSAAAAPLIERYKMLMNSSRACCTEGMVYSLRKAGASDGLVYKFMSDDANFYNIGGRCLMTTDGELDARYPETATASVIADVRNGCLCRGREWFRAMLAPFVDAWNASPEFATSQFLWTYTDGLQRQITVSINDDVRNVLNQLDVCP